MSGSEGQPFDPYAELQLSPDAEPELIKAAFKALAKKYHPDRFTDPEKKKDAEEKMARINEAQSLLLSGSYTPPPPEPPSAPPAPKAPAPAPPSPPPVKESEGPRIRLLPFFVAACVFAALLLLPGIWGSDHLERALELERQGQYQDALTYLNKAVESTPHNKELYRHRARLWEKLGEPEKAAVDLRNAQTPTFTLKPSVSPTHQVPDPKDENPDPNVP